MDEVYAILTVCGYLTTGEPDCIRLQQQGPPISIYQCKDKLMELRIDFQFMKMDFTRFKDYEEVQAECEKESLPYGHKPKEESS